MVEGDIFISTVSSLSFLFLFLPCLSFISSTVSSSSFLPFPGRGWLGSAKVSCILCHWGIQLILAYIWARPAILVVGKGRGGNVFISSVSSISYLFLFLPCTSLSSLPYYFFAPFLWDTTQNDPQRLTCH